MTTEIKEFDPIDKGMGAMTRKFKVVPDCATKGGHKECKTQHRLIRKVYTSLEKKRKAITAPLRAKVALVNQEAKNIVARLDVISEPFKLAIDTRDDEIEIEEQNRITSLKKEISGIQKFITEAIGESSNEIASIIEAVDMIEVDEHFQEFQTEARESLLITKTKLAEMLSQAVQKEVSDKTAAAADEENRKLRAELDAMKAAAEPKPEENQRELKEGTDFTVTHEPASEHTQPLKEVIEDWADNWSIDKPAMFELRSILKDRGFI